MELLLLANPLHDVLLNSRRQFLEGFSGYEDDEDAEEEMERWVFDEVMKRAFKVCDEHGIPMSVKWVNDPVL
jgi:hypothetical protein